MRKVNGQQTQSDGKSSHCLWEGELIYIQNLCPYPISYFI